MFKLGQIFWIQEHGSDYKCVVTGVKECRFLDSKSNFNDYLVQKRRISDSYIIDETLRLDLDTNELTHWYVQGWPVHFEEWRPFNKNSIKLRKPKGIQ